jgi:hypothetical protein
MAQGSEAAGGTNCEGYRGLAVWPSVEREGANHKAKRGKLMVCIYNRGCKKLGRASPVWVNLTTITVHSDNRPIWHLGLAVTGHDPGEEQTRHRGHAAPQPGMNRK